MPLAKSFYEKTIDLMKEYVDEEKEVKEPLTVQQKLLLAAYLNAAMCCLKLSESIKAKDYCSKALHMEQKNEKALFRRGSVSACT